MKSPLQTLDPVRASQMVRVLDLQAQWESQKVNGKPSNGQLLSLQRTFEAYQSALKVFNAGGPGEMPELVSAGPGRLGTWCRALRDIFRQAAWGVYPTYVVAKACQAADRIATREKLEPPAREPNPTDLNGAILQMDAIIAWCNELEHSPRQVVEAAEGVTE